MTRPEITDPDWVDPGEPSGETSSAPETPEADAVEQSRPVRPEGEPGRPSLSSEVNEADAVEQSLTVLDEDEYDR